MNYKIEQKVNYLEDENGNQIEVNEINFQSGTIDQDGEFLTSSYDYEYYFTNNGDEVDMESFQGNGWEIIECDFNEEDIYHGEIESKLAYNKLIDGIND